ncbi:MAG TPA: chemotaxis protein CheW [Anaeromyxobacteraceae bacterium]|nr:chemotaxis protein CheW [Anaeromyxobacteraceae bacterium]
MKTTNTPRTVSEGEGSLAGKYMTFKLSDEVYGLEILKVREIIRVMEITRVPRTPDFMRGVINLRGKVIPVVDLRTKFGMPRGENTDQSVIIVVQCEVSGRELTMGILVDQVLEVLSIEEAQIEPPPPSLRADGGDLDFVLGVGKTEDRVVFLLAIGRVLSENDALAMAQSAAA